MAKMPTEHGYVPPHASERGRRARRCVAISARFAASSPEAMSDPTSRQADCGGDRAGACSRYDVPALSQAVCTLRHTPTAGRSRPRFSRKVVPT
jgi:hypothetical protein